MPTIDPYVMRMMKDDGVVGVRFQWRNVKNLPDISTPEYTKFFRRVRDLDWHVHINQTADRLSAPIATLQAAVTELHRRLAAGWRPDWSARMERLPHDWGEVAARIVTLIEPGAAGCV